tara:strand:+ start:363 stop:683 length:321 start_codon:yes stop_codon:yes gene_type:complete
MKDIIILSKKNANALKKSLSCINANISILNEDKVVKLPKRPIYKKIYTLLLNLYKKNPAKEEPIILTKAVEMGKPFTEKLKRVNTYLKVDPITAPIISARYELIKR